MVEMGTLVATAKIDGGTPITANFGNVADQSFSATISSPAGQAVAANLDATISGGTTPVRANVDANVNAVVSGPDGKPIDAKVVASATVTANLGGTNTPIKLDPIKLDVGLRDTTITFKLFGLIPILTIKVRP